MKSNHSELLEALKIAFCYMPEDVFLTENEYEENLPRTKEDVQIVRHALKSNGINPDELYEKLNPKISSKLTEE